jgi:2-iminobutanoate/2-iminopropanoate deaminase
MVNGATKMQRRNINADSGPIPPAAYSQAVEAGGTRILFISGQIGVEAERTTPTGMTEQARIAWRNLEAQLKAAGMGLDNLVKVTMIIPNPADIPASHPVRAEALGDRRHHIPPLGPSQTLSFTSQSYSPSNVRKIAYVIFWNPHQ